jgi:aryl-alcohol dehydrogenase-like predicted oxidoreductase
MPKIGQSDLEVFPINLGGNTFGWTSTEAESHQVLDAFVAGGGNFIDTADTYSAWVPGNSGGESEKIIGSWMAARGNRDSVVVATKVSQHPEFRGLAASNIAAAADASLARLQSDHIDLYYAHFDDAATPLEETLGAFNDLVLAGKVRYLGISNYSAERIREWIEIATRNNYALPIALQPHYNLVHRNPFESELAPAAAAAQLGVMPYFSLASGFLSGKYRTEESLKGAARGAGAGGYLTAEGLAVVDELDSVSKELDTSIASVAIAWLLSRDGIVAPIASATSAAQLADLMSAPDVAISAAQLARLDEVSSHIASERVAS